MRTPLIQSRCFKYTNPALTPDQTFPIYYSPSDIQDESCQISPPIRRNHLNLDEVPSSPSILNQLPAKAQETYVVYTKIQKMARNHNVPFGYFNQTTWKPQADPATPLIALPRSKWDSNQFAITTGRGPVWVDLIVNNLDEGPHPFHLVGTTTVSQSNIPLSADKPSTATISIF